MANIFHKALDVKLFWISKTFSGIGQEYSTGTNLIHSKIIGFECLQNKYLHKFGLRSIIRQLRKRDLFCLFYASLHPSCQFYLGLKNFHRHESRRQRLPPDRELSFASTLFGPFGIQETGELLWAAFVRHRLLYCYLEVSITVHSRFRKWVKK